MNPLVSVIIPNYRHAEYLDERIQSVLNQSYKNLEVIILDDCSPDDSRIVIEKYRNAPQVTQIVYNQVNSGSTFSQWRKGFDLSVGDLIWIAESDDFCSDDMLEQLVDEFVKDDSTVLAFSTSKYVDGSGNAIGAKNKIGRSVRLDGKSFVRRYMTMNNYLENASSAVFKKKCIPSDDSYTKYVGAGDKRFWIEIALSGRVSIIRKELNSFRQHTNKVTPIKIADGTNFREEYITNVFLVEKMIVSRFRSYITSSYYCRIINNTTFISDEIKKQLLELWGNKLGLFPTLVTGIIRKMRLLFDVYL